MIYKIDFLCKILATFIVITFFIIICNFLYYGFVSYEKRLSKILKRNKLLKISGILFLTSIILIMILNSLSDKLMKEEVISELNLMSNTKTEIFINNQKVQNISLISKLKNMEKQTNKISGKTQIRVQLKNSLKAIDLVFQRNPYDQENYWIFVPKYNHSTNNCIGEIHTDELKKFN